MDNKADEVFQKILSPDYAGVTELNPDDLSDITGGKIDKKAENRLIDGIKLAKSTGVSLSEVLKQLPTYYNLLHALFPDVTQQEAINYIKNNWNKY